MDNRLSRTKVIALLSGDFFLPGCFLAPHYKRPSVDTPASFKEGISVSSTTAAAVWKAAKPEDTLPKGPWWRMFNDPQLDQLEEKVLSSNQTIKQADAQYR